jgi:hypothetical protein
MVGPRMDGRAPGGIGEGEGVKGSREMLKAHPCAISLTRVKPKIEGFFSMRLCYFYLETC